MTARPRRFLAIEDDNVAARVLREVAADLGLGFVRAGSARLARLVFRPREFALAVVDLGLPENELSIAANADGLALLRRMLDADPSLRAVAWSANPDLRRRVHAAALGVRLVDKRGGIEEILAACRSTLGLPTA